MLRFISPLKLTAVLLLWVFTSLVSLNADESYREFTNSDGNVIEARIIECESQETVTIERRDGMQFKNVSVSLFSVEDQKHIAAWRKAERLKYDDAVLTVDSALRFSFARGRDSSLNDYGDIDDVIVEMQPELTIINEERDYSYRHVNVTVYLIVREYFQKGTNVVLSKDEFKLSINADSKASWSGEKRTIRYDPDYGGYVYGGYLIIVRNRNNLVTHLKGSKALFEKNYQNLEDAQLKTGYDRNFGEKIKLYTTFGLK